MARTDETFKKQFSNKLRLLLAEKNMTQKELSKLSGVSTVSISMWLKRKTQPRVDTLQDIAKALNVDMDVLIKGDGK